MLEELDKFKPTETRINYLFRLVNAIYEQSGTIVAACNDTPDQLRTRLGDAIYRRIAGTTEEDPSRWELWDLHLAAKPGKGKGKPGRKESAVSVEVIKVGATEDAYQPVFTEAP